jgi:hypothetical protein
MKYPMLTQYSFEELGEIISEANRLRDALHLHHAHNARMHRANAAQLRDIWSAFDQGKTDRVPKRLREAISRRVVRER